MNSKRKKQVMSLKEVHLWIKSPFMDQNFPPDSGTSSLIRVKENEEDNCIYAKSKEKRKYIFLVLYVDDIFLASIDEDLLAET
jgi:hypothetical protein